MSDVSPQAAPRRPLLARGESLKLEVTAPTNGGGDKYEPQTAQEARELLTPKLSATVKAVSSLPIELRASRFYIEARLLPNYISASSFPGDLLTEVGAIPVGSRADSSWYETKAQRKRAGTRRLILAIEPDGLNALSQLVATGGSTKAARNAFFDIRKLDDISISTPPLPLLQSDATEWEAVLHPETDSSGFAVRSSDELLEKWISLVQSLGGDLRRDYIRPVGGLTFTSITLPPEVAEEAARFNPLRVMRPMPAIRLRPSVGTRTVKKFLPPSTIPTTEELPRVAVFDGGISAVSALFPAPSIDLTTEPEDPEDLIHGTAVTGASLYGLALPGETAEAPALPLDSYRVFPSPPGDPDGYWVLDQIVNTVQSGGYSLVNLSLGPELAVEDDQEPNRWTSTLDQLAWEHDVLFVIAAGNDGDKDASLGLHRVQVPADMANGLSVGAANSPAPKKPWARAPYSSMGPGRQGSRVQPIGLQFGGTTKDQFKLLRPDGTFDYAWGTSFAAPLVTHALSGLAAALPAPTPSVLRAFAVHFAERHRSHIALKTEVGYGRLPISFEPYLQCGPDEVHVLYTDDVTRGDLLGYQIPVPAGLSANLEFRLTLAYASPTDPTEPSEYTQASVEVTFRPHEHLYRFRPPKGTGGKEVVLDQRSVGARQLIEAGWRSGQEPVTHGLGTSGPIPEVQLRDAGKWETVRHTRISLPVDSWFNPRLEITYLARQSGMLLKSPTSMPFALLVSIVDKDRHGTLYDTVRTQFRVLQPAQRAQVSSRLPAAP